MKVWDATSGQETLTLKGHTSVIESVAFSADGKRLASGSWDQTVKVWGVLQHEADAAAALQPQSATPAPPPPPPAK